MIVCYCCSRSGMPAALSALGEGGLDDVILREVPCAGSVRAMGGAAQLPPGS